LKIIGKREPLKAGETVGFPKGIESGERSERKGIAYPLADIGGLKAAFAAVWPPLGASIRF